MSSKALIRAAVTLAVALATSLPSQAAPTLIGDTISFMRAWPDVSTQFLDDIPNTTVAAGDSDARNWVPSSVNINPEAGSIRFNFGALNGMAGSASTFDGYVVSGIDAEIDALSILSNTTSFNVVSLVNTVHGFNISLSGLSAGTLVVGLQLHDPSAPVVPEPASLLLLALGLPAVLLYRRRRSVARVQGCTAA